MTTIKQHHAQWAAKVMPQGASQIQRQEMERAFYAGFTASLTSLTFKTFLLPDDQCVLVLGNLLEEAEVYFATLGKANRDISRQ